MRDLVSSPTVRLLLLLLLLGWPALASASDGDRAQLLFHAEALNGTVVASQHPDRLFNPASVVKVATSLYALERLGPHHRWQTTVGFRGVWDRGAGSIDGQLVVVGAGDPDLHAENAFLIARELNALGIRKVTGDLVVTGPFTFGWEHGAERRQRDETARARTMAKRLRAAFDPSRWNRSIRASWQAMCLRRGWQVGDNPGLVIAGRATIAAAAEHTPLVDHRSSPLAAVLRRFNVYSNNDIIRITDNLGGVAALEAFTRERLERPGVVLETASGEGVNRMTPRVVVRLLGELLGHCQSTGLALHDVLPLPGCDPGPVRRMFPSLARGRRARTATVKTGTLLNTDGGVAVLAGAFDSPDHGTVLFCVAKPRAGRSLYHWRRVEQAWLLDLMTDAGGATTHECGPTLPFSDTLAQVEAVKGPRAPATP